MRRITALGFGSHSTSGDRNITSGGEISRRTLKERRHAAMGGADSVGNLRYEFVRRSGKRATFVLLLSLSLLCLFLFTATPDWSVRATKSVQLFLVVLTIGALFECIPRRLVLTVDARGLLIQDLLYRQHYPWSDVVSRFRSHDGVWGSHVMFDHPWAPDGPRATIEVRLPCSFGMSADQMTEILNSCRDHHRHRAAATTLRPETLRAL